jgi:hypothetical protein
VWLLVPNVVKGVDIHLRQVGQVLMEGKSLAAFLVVFLLPPAYTTCMPLSLQ